MAEMKYPGRFFIRRFIGSGFQGLRVSYYDERGGDFAILVGCLNKVDGLQEKTNARRRGNAPHRPRTRLRRHVP